MKNRIATLSAFAAAFLAPAVALAAPAASGPNDGTFAICMCFGVAIAAVGGGLGQGRAASAALDGICRNPGSADKVFTPLLAVMTLFWRLTKLGTKQRNNPFLRLGRRCALSLASIVI